MSFLHLPLNGSLEFSAVSSQNEDDFVSDRVSHKTLLITIIMDFFLFPVICMV